MSTQSLTKKRPLVLKQFNWRALLVRILVNALTLVITTMIVPSMSFVAPLAIWKIILLAIALGLLNALIKPIIQFLTLSYIFATYGLVVILINTIILYMLSWLLPGYFHVANFLWAFVGGAVMGILSGFLESVFGLTLPIVDEESVSEAMRKAAAFNERRQQVFPFKEIQDEPVVMIPISSLTQTETMSPAKIVSPGAEQAPVSEESRQVGELDIPVVEEPAAAASGPPQQVSPDVVRSEPSANAASESKHEAEEEFAGDGPEDESAPPEEVGDAPPRDDPQQGGGA